MLTSTLETIDRHHAAQRPFSKIVLSSNQGGPYSTPILLTAAWACLTVLSGL